MKKTIALFLTILLSLALMGPGYAGWSNTVSIQHYMETGVLAVGVKDLDAASSPPQLGELEILYLGELGVNIADLGSIYCWGEDCRFDYRGEPYFDRLAVSINSYPGCKPSCTLRIANGGTIPAAIDNVRLHWRNPAGNPPEVVWWELTLPDGQTANGSDFLSLQQGLNRMVLDPEESVKIRLHFLCPHPGLDEMPAVNYTGDLSVSYRQWNSQRVVNFWW